jgi:hypothetical protein
VDGALPEFDFDASPRSAACDNCGAPEAEDLRFVILRGRTRYFGRTLCEYCAEAALEAFLGSAAVEPDAETAPPPAAAS